MGAQRDGVHEMIPKVVAIEATASENLNRKQITLPEYNITLDLQSKAGLQRFDPRHEHRIHNHYQELLQDHRNAAW